MPKCKICGEDVRAGAVMHDSCLEEWEAKLRGEEEKLRKREENVLDREEELSLRERENELYEEFLDYYYEETLDTMKKERRIMTMNLAIAAFNITIALLVLLR